MNLCDRLEKIKINHFNLVRKYREQKRNHHNHNDLNKIIKDFA